MGIFRFPQSGIFAAFALMASLLQFSFSAQAQTDTAGMQLINYSQNFYHIDALSTGITIYSGRTQTGTARCTGLGVNEVCNSCSYIVNDPLGATTVCNDSEVHGDLFFTVTVQTSSNTANFTTTSKIVGFVGSKKIDPYETSLVGGAAPTVNQQITVSFKWGKICEQETTSDNNCAGSFNDTFKIGIDKDNSSTGTLSESVQFTLSHRYVASSNLATVTETNTTALDNDGFYYFTVYPGDGKVYIDNVRIPTADSIVPNLTSGPTGTGSEDASKQKYAALRVFVREASNPPQPSDFAAIDGVSTADLPYDFSSGTLTSSKVTGLVNGQPYVFAIASIDQGGNVTYISDLTSIQALPLAADIQPDNYGLTQAAVPQEVNGLLDDQKCFIATAAYGSVMDEHIQVLRDFRSKILLPNKWGRALVKSYYENSPPLAHWLVHHEKARMAVRWALWPVIVLAKVYLKWGLWFVFALGLLISTFVFRRPLRRQFLKRSGVPTNEL